MRVYQAEKDAGIVSFRENKSGSSSSLVTAQVQVGDIAKYFDGMSIAELVCATSTVQTVEELLGQEQADLALVVAILVSTGWNLNDDIFLPAEVWQAKSTPLHKPMNDNHNAKDILGHIVQTRALDKFGNEIEVADGEDIPSEFDIEVAGVLYRAFPELAERIDEIITKANAGEMFVSMEAWFTDFGYGLINPANGETKLVERTEDTAFLTKHLRTYGGTGKYHGFRLGRVLKNIIFGAQGFVDTPANPESVIKVAANEVAASHVFVNAELSELPEGGVEDVDEKQLKELQESLESKTQEVAALQKSVEEFEAKDYEGQIAALVSQVEELTASVTEASEKVEAVETEKAEIQKQLDETKECADKAEAELDEIRKTEVARDRLAKLSDVKQVEDEEATLAELRDMTDETFALVLKYAGEVKAEEVVDEEPEEKADATEADSDDSETAEEEEAEQAEAALNDVEEDDSADFNATEDVAKSEAERWSTVANKLLGQETKEEGGE